MKRSSIIKILPLVAMLAGCGGGGGGQSSAAPTPSGSTGSSSSATSFVPPTGAVTVPFWTTFGQKNGEAIAQKALEFHNIMLTKGVDVTIDCSYQGGYDDVKNKITNGFSAGNIPTIAIAYPDHVADYLAAEPTPGAYVYSLDSYMNDPQIGFGTQDYLGDFDKSGNPLDREDYVEAFLDEGTHYMRKGATCSMPLMKSSEVLFYNADAVRRALTYQQPEISWGDDSVRNYMSEISWDDLVELARFALNHKAQVLSTLKTPIFYDSDSNFFISKMYQNEIPYASIGADGKGIIDFESGENRTRAENMVREFQTLAGQGLLTTKGVENKYGSDWFKNGETIFEIGSSGGTGYNSPEGSSFKVGICRVPDSNDNPLYISQGPTMTFLKNPSLSDAENDLRMYYGWQFAKFITNPETNVFLCVYGSEGYLPVRYSAYDTDAFVEFLQEGEIYAASAKVLINDIDGKYINTEVFKGSADLRDVCEGIVKQALKGGDVTTLFTDGIREAKGKF